MGFSFSDKSKLHLPKGTDYIGVSVYKDVIMVYPQGKECLGEFKFDKFILEDIDYLVERLFSVYSSVQALTPKLLE